MAKSIMIVGVGGQGTLLASRILGKLLIKKNYDVKMSEVHGMSQRGGSVVTYVKYGEKVYSPVIDKGEADMILSFELLEAARWAEYLKKGGIIITNNQKTNPMSVITGAAQYPENLEEKIRSLGIDLVSFDALKLALEAGSGKAVNLVLLGSLSKYFDFSEKEWEEVIKETVPEKFLEMNLKAFNLGKSV